MKWFKHSTDASEDVRIQRLEERYGNIGYAVFFKCLEMVGKEGGLGKVSFKKYPVNLVCKRLNVSEEELNSILDFMGEIHLCCSKSLNRGVLYFPKFRQKADDYTKRVLRNTEVGTDNVPLEQSREDKITKDERDCITLHYVNLKGWDKKTIINSQWVRMFKGARELFIMCDRDMDKALGAINWVSVQGYVDWTLETAIKKLPDFIKKGYKPPAIQKFEEELSGAKKSTQL